MKILIGILSVIGGSLYYAVLPFIWVARVLLSITLFILNPFIYLSQIMLYIVIFPYRILAKFESLYYFLATAAVIGGCAGIFLFSVDRLLLSVLSMSSSPPGNERRREKGSQPVLGQVNQRLWRSKFSGWKRGGTSITTDNHRLSEERITEMKPRHMSIAPRLGDFYSEWASLPSGSMMRDGALLSTTILEEEDDNHDSDE